MTTDFFYPKNDDEPPKSKIDLSKAGFAPEGPMIPSIYGYQPMMPSVSITRSAPTIKQTEEDRIDSLQLAQTMVNTGKFSTASAAKMFQSILSSPATEALLIQPKHGKEYRFFEDMIVGHGIQPIKDESVTVAVMIGKSKYALVDFLECFENPMNELTMKAIFKILKDMNTLLEKVEKLEQNQTIQNVPKSQESSSSSTETTGN